MKTHRIFIILLAMVTLGAMQSFAAEKKEKKTLQVGVNGMVCSFCANGIEKKLKKQSAVKEFYINLDKKMVVIAEKKEQTITDKEIKELITKSGFVVTKIERTAKPLEKIKEELQKQKKSS